MGSFRRTRQSAGKDGSPNLGSTSASCASASRAPRAARRSVTVCSLTSTEAVLKAPIHSEGLSATTFALLKSTTIPGGFAFASS